MPDSALSLSCDLIRRFEGCRLAAYPDPASGGDPWTIGFGATGPGIQKGVVWTRTQAETDLASRVVKLLAQIRPLITGTTPPADGCVAALCSFAYNVGIGALAKSTLLKKYNAGDRQGAADEFLRWNKAAGKVFDGLTKRRTAERAVFLS